MGNWNINIQGVGCHHNGKPDIDADLAAAEFVKQLRAMGHTVEAATFTSGGKTDLNPPPAAITFLVNGRTCCGFDGEKFKYEWFVCAAELSGTPSMTFEKALGGRGGILSPGQSLAVTEGTIVSVCHTGNA